jgi:hypothetical protein
MWRVTRNASFGLDWSVLVNKRSLLINVTLYAGRIHTGCQPRLFKFETAMWIVAVAALQGRVSVRWY